MIFTRPFFLPYEKIIVSKDYIANYGESEKIEDLKKYFIMGPTKSEKGYFSDLERSLKLEFFLGQRYKSSF